MMKGFGMILATSALLCVAGCNTGSNDAKPTAEAKGATEHEAKAPAPQKPATEPAKAAQPAAAQPAAAVGAVTTPEQQTYPLDAIKAVPEDCASPEVLLASAPKSVGADYAWNVTRQALLANQQFHVVAGAPSAPGEVELAPYGYNDGAYALVARCKDGGTCNRLAAMYKAIVRSSNPQVVCGNRIQGISGAPVSSFRWSTDPKANLPQDGEVQAMCARLSACTIATDHATPGDPFLECQKAPSKFKTECAQRYPCAEVLACTGK